MEAKTQFGLCLIGRLRIPLDANVVTDQEALTWIFTTRRKLLKKSKQSLQQLGVEVVRLNE